MGRSPGADMVSLARFDPIGTGSEPLFCYFVSTFFASNKKTHALRPKGEYPRSELRPARRSDSLWDFLLLFSFARWIGFGGWRESDPDGSGFPDYGDNWQFDFCSRVFLRVV